MRRPVTDVALLAYIAKRKVNVINYTEATRACKSSSSASRALHQLIREGILEPKPKLLGLRYVTQYVVTPKGKQASELALQLTRLREVASRMSAEADGELDANLETTTTVQEEQVEEPREKPAAAEKKATTKGRRKMMTTKKNKKQQLQSSQ